MKCPSCNVHMNQVPGTVEQVTKTVKQAKVQCPKCKKNTNRVLVFKGG